MAFDAGRSEVSVGAKLDRASFKKIDAAVAEYSRKKVEATVAFKVDRRQLDRGYAMLKKWGQERRSATLAFKVNDGQYRAASAKVSAWGRKRATAKLGIDVDSGGLERARLKMAQVARNRRAKVEIDVDGEAEVEGASRALRDVDRNARQAGDSGSALSRVWRTTAGDASKVRLDLGFMGGSVGSLFKAFEVLTPLVITAGGAIVQLGAVALGAAGGVGALGTAMAAAAVPAFGLGIAVMSRLNAVMDAYKQRQQAQIAGAIDQGKTNTQTANSVDALANAQDSLKAAHDGVSQAQDQVTSAVDSYNEAVARVRRQIKDAARDEAQAARDVSAAEHDAALARTEALQTMQDLNREQHRSMLDVRDAELGLADARDTEGSSYQTLLKLQREGKKGTEEYEDAQRAYQHAQLEVRKSEDALGEARIKHNKILRENARFAREGAKAFEPYRNALERVDEAQRKLAQMGEKYQRLVKVGVDRNPEVVRAALAVKRAHEGVAAALVSVERAQRGVDKARRGTKDTSVDPAALRRADYLTQQLTKSERGFLHALEDVRDQLKKELQPATDAVFDSLTRNLRKGGSFVADFGDDFKQLGETTGKTLSDITDRLTTRKWKSFWHEMFDTADDLIPLSGEIATNVAGMLREIADAAAPELVDFFRYLRDVTADWLDFLEKHPKKVRKEIHELALDLRDVLELTGAIVNVFAAWIGLGDNEGRNWINEWTDSLNSYADRLRHDKGTRDNFIDWLRDSKEFIKDLVTVFGPFVHALAFYGRALTDVVNTLGRFIGLKSGAETMTKVLVGLFLYTRISRFAKELAGIPRLLARIKTTGLATSLAESGAPAAGSYVKSLTDGLKRGAGKVKDVLRRVLFGGRVAGRAAEEGGAAVAGEAAGGMAGRLRRAARGIRQIIRRLIFGGAATGAAASAGGEAVGGVAGEAMAGGLRGKSKKVRDTLRFRVLGGALAGRVATSAGAAIGAAFVAAIVVAIAGGEITKAINDALGLSKKDQGSRATGGGGGAGTTSGANDFWKSFKDITGVDPPFGWGGKRGGTWTGRGFIRNAVNFVRRQAGGPGMGGAALVGEEGPELVHLPVGAQVTPHRQTADQLRRRGRHGRFDDLVEDIDVVAAAGEEAGARAREGIVSNLKKASKDAPREARRLSGDVSDEWHDLRRDTERDFRRLSRTGTDELRDFRRDGSREASRFRSNVVGDVSGARRDSGRHLDRLARTARERLAEVASSARRHGGRFRDFVRGSMGSADRASFTGLDYIATATNKALKSFDADPVHLSVPRPRGLATGGVPNPAGSTRDDHVLIDPTGRPVAALSGTEGIVNDPQMGVINQALGFAKAMGASAWGSLGDLWQSGMRHATGGRLGGLPGFQSGGQPSGIVGIPGMPGEYIQKSILDDVVGIIRKYHAKVTDGYAPTGHAAGGEHPLGLATDLVPGRGGSWGQLGKLANDAGYPNPPNRPFRWIGWLNEPDHGPPGGPTNPRFPHLHLSWLHGAHGFKGVGGGEDIPKIKVKGPDGPLKDIVQKAVNKVRKAADSKLDEAAAASMPAFGQNFSVKGYGPGQKENRKLGQKMAEAYKGWGHGEQWAHLDHLWGVDESSWDEGVANFEGSGAYGIAQALPASKYPPAGRPGAPGGIKKARAQIGWGLTYIKDRYGDPIHADAARHAKGWYGLGGLLRRFQGGGPLAGASKKRSKKHRRSAQWPGIYKSLVSHGTKVPEWVLNVDRPVGGRDPTFSHSTKLGQVKKGVGNLIGAARKSYSGASSHINSIEADITRRTTTYDQSEEDLVVTTEDRGYSAKRAQEYVAYMNRHGQAGLRWTDGMPYIDISALAKRKGELRTILKLRAKQLVWYKKWLAGMERVYRIYRGAIHRLRKLRGRAKSKGAVKKFNDLIGNYKKKLSGTMGAIKGTRGDRADSWIEASSLAQEFTDLFPGAKEELKQLQQVDTSETGPDIATQVAQALADFNENREQLYASFGANYAPARQPLQFRTAAERAAGMRHFGAFGGEQSKFATTPFDLDSWRDANREGVTINQEIHFAGGSSDERLFPSVASHEMRAALG